MAVRDVSLDVNEREIVALIGANGAGKSTTLGAIVGLVPARTGRIQFRGEDISRLPPERAVQRGISLVPEGRRVFSRLTVGENLMVGAVTRRTQRREVEAEKARVLELFPILRTRERSLAGTLSGGEQQQLAIARALMAGPQLLLLDEPSLGLAPKLVNLVFDLIAQLVERHQVAILLVEQNVRRALDVAARAYVMSNGRIVMQGRAEDLRHAPEVEQAYLGIGRPSSGVSPAGERP